MIKIENLIYKEDNEVKCFISKYFNFVYSKHDSTSCSWGETQDITPNYNPISPETIIIKLDNNFVFNRDEILKLISITPEKTECVSCVTNIILTGDELYNNDEVKKLIQYIEMFNILCFIELNFEKEISLKEIYKIKYLNISNIILNISNSFNLNDLVSSINILSENNILLNCNFFINDKNFKNIISLFEMDEWGNSILNTLIFSKKIKKINIDKLVNVIKTKKLFNTIVKLPLKSRKKYEIKSLTNDEGLFSCKIDFVKNVIYPGENFIENTVNIKEVKKIGDYWNSDQFNDVRKNLLKGF